MPTRPLAVPLALVLFCWASIGAPAQPATPADAGVAIDDHLTWVLDLFDGGAADLDAAAVEARFDAGFLDLVPPGELIATVRQRVDDLGPLELVERRSDEPGEFVGIFRSESGDGVMIAFAVDRESGLITGFFITPAQLPGDATPVASPSTNLAATPDS